MRIAIVTTGAKRIPGPRDSIYAPGQIIYNLTEGLVGKGHDVSLFASKDSETSAKLFSYDIESSFEAFGTGDPSTFVEMRAMTDLYLSSRLLEEHRKKPFDIIHAHDYRRIMFLARNFDRPIIITHHGSPTDDAATDISKLCFKHFYQNLNFIGISDKQIELGREYFNYIAKVNNSVDTKKFSFNSNPEDIVLSAGRIIECKNSHYALEAAILANQKIVLAGSGNGFYWENKIKPLLQNPLVEYIGHQEYDQMPAIFAKAKAFILPITWDEPFGLVIIEAMACGTPVIAFANGSVPELIIDGQTGFVVKENTPEALAEAIKKIDQIDRRKCREHVEKHFSVEKMVDNYEDVYKKYLEDLKK